MFVTATSFDDGECAGGSGGEERVIPILRESPTHQQQSRLRWSQFINLNFSGKSPKVIQFLGASVLGNPYSMKVITWNSESVGLPVTLGQVLRLLDWQR